MCFTQNLNFGFTLFLVDHQGEFLYTQGFIDTSAHLSNKPVPECQFRFEQKSYYLRGEENRAEKGQSIVFGTEVLIKHVFSNYYLSIELGEDGNELLRLRPDCNQFCYFELLPQRTFEHKGDYINFESFFVIKHSIYKCYLGSNILENGSVRARMERQIKTSKVKESHRINLVKGLEDQDGAGYHQQDLREIIESQWDIREELKDQLRRTEQKLKCQREAPLLHNQEDADSQLEREPEEDPIFLPLKRGVCKPTRDCSIEKHIHTMWRARKVQRAVHPFLQDNDYIYFISSSKSRGLMNVACKRGREEFEQPQIQFIKNQGENEYICSAIFSVEVLDREYFSLKHVLSGRYFPFSSDNSKKLLKLKALLPFNSLENKLPPFHLIYQERFYPTSIEEDATTCGFWLNKVNKLELNEILSLEGVSHQEWIKYLLGYLDSNRKRRQEILQQFKLLQFVIEKLIHPQQRSPQVFKLLFKMISGKQGCLREATAYLNSNILLADKALIIDILSELFDNELGYVEKFINPDQVGYILKDFLLEESFSVNYMRIFRLFCGHHSQPCQRNQNLIFSFFFHHLQQRTITHSAFLLQQQLIVPPRYKFKIAKQKDLIVFETEGVEKPFSDFERPMQEYIRQYYYLLGDCLRLNKANTESFRKDLGEVYSLDLLLDILQREELAILRGPITHLLNCGYLEPQYRFKLYVFVPHYESMCYNGSLIALHRSQKTARLLCYIFSQVEEIRKTCDRLEELQEVLGKGESEEVRIELAGAEERVQCQFKSTQFRHLLQMIRFSIENAYWESESSVVALVEVIGRFYKSKKALKGESLSSYNQISERKNYLDSTVQCLDIATLLLDLQVNLALSHLLSLPEEKISDSDIEASAKRIQGLELIRCSFGKFKLSEHEDSRLVKRSLGLVRKFYQLRFIINEHYLRAVAERKSAGDMRPQIDLIKATLYSLRLSNQVAINTCQEYISQCLPSVDLQNLEPDRLLEQGYCLNSFGSSCQPHSEFQILAYRLGVLEALREDLWRYANLRGKEKGQEEGCVYWKMLLLLALIKANPELRRIASGWRKWLIGLVGEQEMREGEVSLLVLQVLAEIYRDWRGLIVADSEHVLLLCEQFVRLVSKDNAIHLGSNAFLNSKLNRILSLLLIFLQVEGRQVRNHFPTVLNEIFDKESLIQCIIKLRNIDNLEAHQPGSERPSRSIPPAQLHNNILFKLLLHLLAKTLDQKPERIGFTLPEAGRLLNLILAVGKQNWELVFQIYRCLSPQVVAGNWQLLLSVLKVNLNHVLELISEKLKAAEEGYISKNIEISVILHNFPILLKVTKTIIDHVDEGKNNVLAEKIALIEKLFLLSRFAHPPLRQKLLQFALSHKSKLKKSEQQIGRFSALRLQNFKIDEIKKFEGNLISFNLAEESLEKQQNHFSMGQFYNIFGQSWSKGEFSRAQPQLGGGFEIGEVQEFIHSLIFMNRSEGFSSETDLKTFFLSFLSNTFPAPCADYGDRLRNHQEKLLSYGAAELITTILQEKYREGGGLFLSLFQLGNRLLESGSIPAQAQFLEIFKRDHKNRIFENITTVIERSLLSLRFYYQQEGEGGLQGWDSGPGERGEACEMLRRVFRFLQLLCENDNQEMKKYVFSQTNEQGVVKYMSVNFIELAIHLVLQISYFADKQLRLGATSREIGANLLETIIFIMDFLIQVCQYPAIKNQMYLCNTDFFNLLTLLPHFASLRPADRQLASVIFRIERKVVLLLRGLLEERNSEIILMVSKKMECSHLKYLIESSLSSIGVTSRQELLSYLKAKEDELIEEIENVVDLLIISRVLGVRVVERFGTGVQGVLEEVDKKIREIEVDFKGQLTKMYFCYRPSFDLLSENTRNFFISKSSLLESRNQKLRELLNSRAIINQDILNSKSRQIFISERTITYLFVFSLLLCFLLVLMQLFFYSINPAGMALDPLELSLISAASLMQLLLSLIYIMLWGANISSLTKEKLRSRYKTEATSKMSSLKYYYLLTKEIYLEEGSSLHATLLLGLSVGGCLIDPRLYSFVFLYSFAKIETLSSILQAIRLTLGKLAVVCLFALTFAFVFGFLSIDNYITVLYDNESVDVDIGQISSHCSSIVGCIDSLYTQRIIGETPSRQGETSHYGRFFSDTVHWSFFDILFTNIIAAIIIDKFAELRNIKQRIENEQRNRCFICSAEKASVQRKDEDFDKHIARKHYLWDYFFYLYYLEKLKSHTEYTGIEYWIVRQVKENKIDWFPSDEALREDDDEKKINSLFEAFMLRMQKKNEGEKSRKRGD